MQARQYVPWWRAFGRQTPGGELEADNPVAESEADSQVAESVRQTGTLPRQSRDGEFWVRVMRRL
jgi:hypothetical protein